MTSAMKQAYEYLVSFATIMLVIAGIGGMSFHAFRDRGWIETLLDHFWSFEMAYPTVAIPLTLVAGLAVYSWRQHNLALGRVSRLPTVFLYCLMGAGAYFIAQMAMYGGI